MEIFGICSIIYLVIGVFLAGFCAFDKIIGIDTYNDDKLAASVFLFWPIYLVFTILKCIIKFFILLFETFQLLFKSLTLK